MAKPFRRAKPRKNLARQQQQRVKQPRVLIVCEGAKTEPLYFQNMIDVLGLNTAQTKAIKPITIEESSGSAPIRVVDSAIHFYKTAKKSQYAYDKVFCIIDRDTHSTYEAALDKLKAQSPKNTFIAIPSVPCFEYWLLLHYEYTTSPYHQTGRESGCECAYKKLVQHMPDYKKGVQTLYEALLSNPLANPERAKQYAERGLQAAKDNNTDNPTTYVHRLVLYLEGLQTGRDNPLPSIIEAHFKKLLPVAANISSADDVLETLQDCGLEDLLNEISILSASTDTKKFYEHTRLYLNAFLAQYEQQIFQQGSRVLLQAIKN